jgi:protein TonB
MRILQTAMICVVFTGGPLTHALTVGPAGNPPSSLVDQWPTQAVQVSGSVMKSMLVKEVQPYYDPDIEARGSVVLGIIIEKDGSVSHIRVISGFVMLTGAAIDAVRQWKYKPYLLNGQPVEVDTTVVVNFRR